MEDLEKLQQELDKKKWLESEIARQNLAGKMFYCDYCPFKDKYLKICGVSYDETQKNSLCAKAELEKRKAEKLVIKPRFSEIEKDIKDAEFMKEVNRAYEEALSYALFDTLKNDANNYQNRMESIGCNDLRNIKQNKKRRK